MLSLAVFAQYEDHLSIYDWCPDSTLWDWLPGVACWTFWEELTETQGVFTQEGFCKTLFTGAAASCPNLRHESRLNETIILVTNQSSALKALHTLIRERDSTQDCCEFWKQLIQCKHFYEPSHEPLNLLEYVWCFSPLYTWVAYMDMIVTMVSILISFDLSVVLFFISYSLPAVEFHHMFWPFVVIGNGAMYNEGSHFQFLSITKYIRDHQIFYILDPLWTTKDVMKLFAMTLFLLRYVMAAVLSIFLFGWNTVLQCLTCWLGKRHRGLLLFCFI